MTSPNRPIIQFHRRPPRIAVIGPAAATDRQLAVAEEVGREIARGGAVLVCGGLGGVMAAAARGAKAGGGLTVGILPGTEAEEANPFIDLPIATGLGEARNVLVVRGAEAVIAVGGAYGTLSEIALALKLGKPIIALESWELRAPDGQPVPVVRARCAVEAVQKALATSPQNNR